MNSALLNETQNTAIVGNGLLAYWALNDGIGTTARNLINNTYPLNFLGSPLPTWVDGKNGKAVNFVSASQDYLQTSSPVSTATSNITMMAWFKSNTPLQAGQYIFHNGSDISGSGYGFALNSESTVDGSILLLYSAIAWIDTGFKVTDTGWHHGAMSILSTGVPVFVLDGINIFTGLTALRNTPTIYTEVGRNNYPALRYFNGMIDDVRFYSRALSNAEVFAIWNTTKS